jgi:hypothetical protein
MLGPKVVLPLDGDQEHLTPRNESKPPRLRKRKPGGPLRLGWCPAVRYVVGFCESSLKLSV